MKAMKAMAAMKAMKKKSVSKIAHGKFSKVLVFRGSKGKTSSGLTSTDLIKNARGKIVSKKKAAAAKKRYATSLKGWTVALQKARKALGVTGFVPPTKGSALYKKAKELYR